MQKVQSKKVQPKTRKPELLETATDEESITSSEDSCDSEGNQIIGFENYEGNPIIIQLIDKKVIEDEFGLKPAVIIKKSTYNSAIKESINKYRLSHPEVIAKISKKSYQRIKADPEKRKKFNKQCGDSQKRKREALKKERELKGDFGKKAGRPKLIKDFEVLKQKKKEWNKTYRDKQAVIKGVVPKVKKEKPVADPTIEKKPRGRPRKIIIPSTVVETPITQVPIEEIKIV